MTENDEDDDTDDLSDMKRKNQTSPNSVATVYDRMAVDIRDMYICGYCMVTLYSEHEAQ